MGSLFRNYEQYLSGRECVRILDNASERHVENISVSGAAAATLRPKRKLRRLSNFSKAHRHAWRVPGLDPWSG